jgi:hypothetical protein
MQYGTRACIQFDEGRGRERGVTRIGVVRTGHEEAAVLEG